MLLSALAAYLHYLGILGILGALTVEWLLCKPGLSALDIGKIARADLVYGVCAGLVLATGVLRVMYFGKGSAYYLSNPIFLLKIGLFLVIGLISIYPTVVFLAWRKSIQSNRALTPDDGQIFRLARVIRIELAILISLPLLAALMARGIGL
jgi:putative membrane protein